MPNMPKIEAKAGEPEWAAFMAIDWADRKHVWKMVLASGERTETGELEQTPEALDRWACELAQRFAGKPVAVAVEQRRGALVYGLMKYAHLVIFPVHPTTSARFREALHPSGSKDDPGDTDVLLELLCQHREHLSWLEPDTVETRLIQTLVEDRRRLVDEKTRQKNRLTDRLKMYFPQALEWFDLDTKVAWDALRQWPTLRCLQANNPAKLATFFRQHNCRSGVEERIQQIYAAVPATEDRAVVESGALAVKGYVDLIEAAQRNIKEMERQIEKLMAVHEESFIWASMPGAGPVLESRLLAAFGTRRERFHSACEVQCCTGIAPVTERSGKSQWVHARWRCSRFLRQTFHEYAQHSLGSSAWARGYYQMQRDRGKHHHAAVRALAAKWIRVMFRCWRDRQPYDERIYMESLAKRKSPLVAALAPLMDVTRLKWDQVCGFSKLSVDLS